MAVSRQVDLLEPIDLAEHLGKVELYLGQVCQIAGISKMQLDYWTNKAQIPTKGKKQRIYDIDALETVMLIKQAKDKGLNLGAAIDAARRFRESQATASAAGSRTRALGQAPPQPDRRLFGRQRVDEDARRRAPGRRGSFRRGKSTSRQSPWPCSSQAFSGTWPSSRCRRRTTLGEQLRAPPPATGSSIRWLRARIGAITVS